MKRFNPYTAALVAAAEQLTCDQAMAYYQSRAMADIDRCLTAYGHTVAFCQFVVALGAQLRDWCDELEYNARASQPQLALAGSTPIAFLPERSSAYRKPEPVSFDNGVIVPPVTSIEESETQIQQLLEECDEITSYFAQEEAKTKAADRIIRRNQLARMNKTALKKECRKAKVRGYSRMSHQQMLDALCPPMPAPQQHGDTVQSGGRVLSIS